MASTQDVPPRGGSMTVPAHAPTTSTPPPLPYWSKAPAAAGETKRTSGRAKLVGTILACLVISVALMVGSIAYRGWGVADPTTAVIVDGDASFDGTTVTVTELDGSRLRHTSLTAANNYRAAVLVEPGQYRVIIRRDDVALLPEQHVTVERMLAVQFDLTKMRDLPSRQAGPGGAGGPGNP